MKKRKKKRKRNGKETRECILLIGGDEKTGRNVCEVHMRGSDSLSEGINTSSLVSFVMILVL